MPRVPQTLSNHTRVVPFYHFGMYGLLLLLLIGAGYQIFRHRNDDLLMPIMFFLLVCCVLLVSFYARQFALRAQDRAIRAEETLRYFILTGKRMPKLSMRQIIAIRFASDDEFVELTSKIVLENLSPSQIKKEIKTWRPDYHRA